MKKLALLLMVAAVSVAHAGKVYIYKDASGKTVYSDLPPEKTDNVQQKQLGANVIDTSGYPYEVQQAIQNYPVTLWANNCGAICDKARALLKERGVPYTEKDPGANAEVLDTFKKLTGSNSIPVLQVGKRIMQNFNPATWNTALTDAGYPLQLPAAIRGPKPTKP